MSSKIKNSDGSSTIETNSTKNANNDRYNKPQFPTDEQLMVYIPKNKIEELNNLFKEIPLIAYMSITSRMLILSKLGRFEPVSFEVLYNEFSYRNMEKELFYTLIIKPLLDYRFIRIIKDSDNIDAIEFRADYVEQENF